MLEGDSASSTELYALLSALADVPLKQTHCRDRIGGPAWQRAGRGRCDRQSRRLLQGIEILTGRPAGKLGPEGGYPTGTIHGLVAERLHSYANLQRTFAAAPNGETPGREVAGGAERRISESEN